MPLHPASFMARKRRQIFGWPPVTFLPVDCMWRKVKDLLPFVTFESQSTAFPNIGPFSCVEGCGSTPELRSAGCTKLSCTNWDQAIYENTALPRASPGFTASCGFIPRSTKKTCVSSQSVSVTSPLKRLRRSLK